MNLKFYLRGGFEEHRERTFESVDYVIKGIRQIEAGFNQYSYAYFAIYPDYAVEVNALRGLVPARLDILKRDIEYMEKGLTDAEIKRYFDVKPGAEAEYHADIKKQRDKLFELIDANTVIWNLPTTLREEGGNHT